jgi:hypothetical protein
VRIHERFNRCKFSSLLALALVALSPGLAFGQIELTEEPGGLKTDSSTTAVEPAPTEVEPAEEPPVEEAAPAEEPAAEEPSEPEEPSSKDERARRIHNPRGSIVLGVSGGASFGRDLSVFSLGAQFGYAVYHGILPGVRGLVFFGDYSGGEAAGTLVLTPPISFQLVPFVMGDAGYRWEEVGNGPIAGVGVGAYIGHPADRLNVQLGWIFRRFWYGDGRSADASGPLVAISLRF